MPRVAVASASRADSSSQPPRDAASLPPSLGGVGGFAGGGIQERMRWQPGTGLAARAPPAVAVDGAPSHYAVLGVPRNFTEVELKKQYRLLALRYHPDSAAKHGIDADEAEVQFQALQAAYEVLHDPIRRAQYDRELRLQQQREWRRAGIGVPPFPPRDTVASSDWFTVALMQHRAPHLRFAQVARYAPAGWPTCPLLLTPGETTRATWAT